MLDIKPNNTAAYRLMHEGAQALAIAEYNGIRIDIDYCNEQMNLLESEDGKHGKIPKMRERLSQFKEVQKWSDLYGSKFNLNSDTQLIDVLFKHEGYVPIAWTDPKGSTKRQPKTDEDSLEALNIPMVKELIKYKKLQKNRAYLVGILREQTDGFLHPFFNLHTVKTYRSSSNHPNFQNMPVRDKNAGRIVRGCFVPRPGNMLCSIDYGGIEVKGAEWYHHDPVMLQYIEDLTKDMHRDMAAEIYMMTVKEVSKEARYSAKNGFVFPVFYGSYWRSITKPLWDNIEKLHLETKTKIPLKKHLQTRGIKNYHDFETHIQKVENHFWNVLFKEYKTWKDRWVEEYYKKGYFCSLSGFVYQGIMSRNEIINYPVQGVAFHCLLWSFIELMKIFEKKKLKSKLVGQIHDEIVFDICPSEKDDVMEIARRVMCDKIKRDWAPWINTHLAIDVEISPIDGRWSDMETEYELRGN